MKKNLRSISFAVARATLLLALVACDAQAPVGDPATDGQVPAASDGQVPAASPAEPAGVTVPAQPPVLAGTEEPGQYTSLAPADCTVTEVSEEDGGSTSLCAGLGGYRLTVRDSDARMSIDVIAPDGARQPLNLSIVAGGAFSSLGPRAEWRFADGSKTPDALIARLEAYEYPDQPERSRSYLVVAKLAGKGSCVIARIEPAPGQNLRARQVADRAAEHACLEPDVGVGTASQP